MVTRRTFRKALVGPDVAVAFSVVIALYLLKFVTFQPVQIPAYLMIVAYDVVEVVFPVLAPFHPIAFPVFLYVLAVIGAGVTRWLGFGDGEEGAWTRTAGGVCLVVGSLSVLLGAFLGGPLVSPTDNPTPLAVATATAIGFLGGAWWLLRPRSV